MAEFDLEQELQLELAKLDEIFSAATQYEDSSNQSFLNGYLNRSASNDLSSPPQARVAYELAEAEIEKEELQDQLRILLSKTEEFDTQLLQLHAENQDLFARYTLVVRENERLKQELTDSGPSTSTPNTKDTAAVQAVHCSIPSTPVPPPFASPNTPHRTIAEEDYHALEFKFAETRAKLARLQQNLEDLTMARELTVKELEREKASRLRAEKERDAYSAAYELSLKKIDTWAQTKALAKRVLSVASLTGTNVNNNNNNNNNNSHSHPVDLQNNNNNHHHTTTATTAGQAAVYVDSDSSSLDIPVKI